MKKRKYQTFTLIELLVVMLLMGLIMTLMLPAFNRMIRGNRVDLVTSNLKLGLEQAQSNAIRSRKYVAIVLPNDRRQFDSDKAVQAIRPFCYGGFRLAYVQPDGANWKFLRWLPNQEWQNAPDGAALVRVLDPDNSDFNSYKIGDGVNNVISDVKTSLGDGLADLKDALFSTPGSNATYKTNIDECLIVFSPYGGLKSDKDLRLMIAEAVFNGDDVVYPTKDAGNKPINWLMLSINKFTGRVEYYPLPE
ncbi:MAG: prepilin-type N-terminal cleavage/methylation domain-containing protein [Victivallales bacterium]|jgi:type II secretory pathway pseudopilin PulG|nr:prepilin-type N-terminal cleavage/methylation domain-containing protein [Victivallales bacterium]